MFLKASMARPRSKSGEVSHFNVKVHPILSSKSYCPAQAHSCLCASSKKSSGPVTFCTGHVIK